MYKFLITLFCTSISILGLAQGSVELEVYVRKNGGAKFSNAEVLLREKGGKELRQKTDAQGLAKFSINEGQYWDLFVNGFDMKKVIEVPERGTSHQRTTLTYNPELHKRLDQQTTDRSGLQIEAQDYSNISRPQVGRSLVQVRVTNRKRVPQQGVKVRMVDVQNKRAFTAITDFRGMARFMLQPNTNWDIDVEEVLNISFLAVKRAGMIQTVTAFYEAPDINEKRQGDTLIQNIIKKEPVSGRAFYSLKVSYYQKGFVPGERVYLQTIHGKDVYVAETNAEGEARFMLPIGFKYMIHFDYQRDVDVVNLKHARGFVQGHMELTYRPDPRLEHPELFIPKRDELFFVSFKSFFDKQYPKPEPGKQIGIHLKWANKFGPNAKEAVLEIGYAAGNAGKKVPLNICFVLDNSGSMAGYYRIEKLKEGLKDYIRQLDQQDRISIVTFETNMEIVARPQVLGKDRNDLISKIDSIEPKGGTNMREALIQGYKFVDDYYDPNKMNMVIVLSDGYDQNKAEELQALQQPYNKRITCSSIGVGESYNVSLLTLLAESGNGRHFHIGESEEFEQLFVQQLKSLDAPVAKDVKLEVIYRQPLRFKHLYGLEPDSSSQKRTLYQVPHLYAGNNDIVLAKFDLDKPDPNVTKLPVIIRFTYTDGETGERKVEEKTIQPEWEPAAGKYEYMVEAKVKKMYAIAEINRALKRMADHYEAGNAGEAERVLLDCYARMKQLFPDADDKDVQELIKNMVGYMAAFKNLARKKRLQKSPN